MWLNLGFLVCIYNCAWLPCHSMLTRNPSEATVIGSRFQSSRTGSYYLNNQNPLWILNDQVTHTTPSYFSEPLRITTTAPYYYHKTQSWRQAKQKTPQSRRYDNSHDRIPVPLHYMSSERSYNKTLQSIPLTRRERYNAADNQLTMPIFDGIPGDESVEALPLFVYSGPKGELILNTMLSVRQYPMQEPIPGGVLYPPSSPIFRPTPIVAQFRPRTERQQALNLTLIPFYEHEAITLRPYAPYEAKSAGMTSTMENSATETPTTVLYAAPVSKRTVKKVSKNRRLKKAKKYNVYRSPHEVHWQPTSPTLLQMEAPPATTGFPLTLDSPLQQDHGYAYTTMLPMKIGTTTALPDYTAEQQAAEASKFRIVYVDESTEKPTTMSTPTEAPPYTLSTEYYAFPVYTLGKLLQPDAQLSTNTKPNMKLKDNSEDAEDTWFILKSRYKGPHKEHEPYRLSSKYTSLQNLRRDQSGIKSLIEF